MIPPEDSYLDETAEDRERESLVPSVADMAKEMEQVMRRAYGDDYMDAVLAEVVCIEHDEIAICMNCGTGREL